ncbi:MAG: GtrA family protein [bacterium]|nr:GtrA family protein [bacterium]
MAKLLFPQFVKYSVVAAISTFLGWAAFNLLIFMTDTAQGLIVNLFAIVAFVISRTFSFFWTKSWVFQHRKMDNFKNEWIKFFGISVILTIINLLVIHIGVNIIGPSFGINPALWANIFFLLTIPISLFGNFFGYKILVFR